jgi:[acyl-carrier-protein] S-malonyltransferase
VLFVFPGQGAQKIGMGKDVYDKFSSARDVFHEVDDAIAFGLSDLIFNGSSEVLKSTENAQPALMAVSMAFVRVMKEEFGINIQQKATFLAGHSLGEYTALCASGVISVAEAAKILRVRGTAMANACPTGGAMAAIIGLDIDIVQRITAEVSSTELFVQVANDNSMGQVIISGHKPAIERAMEKSIDLGAKKTTFLDVSGAFHCKLMQDAVAPLADILNSIEFKEPAKPIISNVTAKAENGNFKTLLQRQIVNPVRWRESILFANKHGVSKCVEIGAGRVLTGLIKRIVSTMETFNIGSVDQLNDFIAL